MLEIKNCTFSYSRIGEPAIDSLSLSLQTGGVYGLLGSNGAGKTTLLQLICGLLTPSSGSVLFNDVNTRRRLPSTQQDIMIVPEEVEMPAISLRQYAKVKGAMYPNFSVEALEHYIEIFEIPEVRNLTKTSMGQKKKIALAFALACNTPLLILDEPTNGLDIPGKSAFRRAVTNAMSDNKIIIISTHQVRDVSQILDHVIIINNHKVLLDCGIPYIQSKLKFIDTTDATLRANALYSINGIGGSSIILPNNDDIETEVNLETLFGFTISEPKQICNILNPELQ